MKSLWWIIALIAVAIVLPWGFYDWAHHRHDGFLISMLSQMGMMVILALSYNMLLGQAGLFSLCHATFFGIGGYATVHFLNANCLCQRRLCRYLPV
jgi:branched-chain amino acid transport system permease protein